MGWAAAGSAAVLYALMNVALAASRECEPIVAAFYRALIPAIVFTPIVIARAAMRKRRSNRRSVFVPIAAFCLAAIVTQLGNFSFQKALTDAGMQIAVPTAFGFLLVLSVMIEGLVIRKLSNWSYGAAIASVVGISIVAANREMVEGSLSVESGLVYALLAGGAWALFTLSLKYVVRRALSSAEVVALNAIVGSVTLGAIAVYQFGTSGIFGASSSATTAMIVAGGLNGAAFLALATAFQFIAASNVNLVNSMQIGLSAAFGIVLFGEPLTWGICLGILLTMVALLLAGFGLTREVAGYLETEPRTRENRL